MQKVPEKISFDFDGTLNSSAAIQELVGLYQAAGKQVFILTSRPPQVYLNHDLYDLARRLEIPSQRYLYAWGSSKSELIKEHGIDLHFDNDPHAIHDINVSCGPEVGILIHYHYLAADIFGE